MTCGIEWVRWGSIKDVVSQCPTCFSEEVKKRPSDFFVVNEAKEEEEISSKQNVTEHIEENRQILKKMRQEAQKGELVKDV